VGAASKDVKKECVVERVASVAVAKSSVPFSHDYRVVFAQLGFRSVFVGKIHGGGNYSPLRV